MLCKKRQEKSLGLHEPRLESLTWPSGAASQSHGPLQGTSSQLPPGMSLFSISALPLPQLSGFPGGARAGSPELLPASQDFTVSLSPPCRYSQNLGLSGRSWTLIWFLMWFTCPPLITLPLITLDNRRSSLPDKVAPPGVVTSLLVEVPLEAELRSLLV